jgi:hypothetical protein
VSPEPVNPDGYVFEIYRTWQDGDPSPVEQFGIASILADGDFWTGILEKEYFSECNIVSRDPFGNRVGFDILLPEFSDTYIISPSERVWFMFFAYVIVSIVYFQNHTQKIRLLFTNTINYNDGDMFILRLRQHDTLTIIDIPCYYLPNFYT